NRPYYSFSGRRRFLDVLQQRRQGQGSPPSYSQYTSSLPPRSTSPSPRLSGPWSTASSPDAGSEMDALGPTVSQLRPCPSSVSSRGAGKHVYMPGYTHRLASSSLAGGSSSASGTERRHETVRNPSPEKDKYLEPS